MTDPYENRIQLQGHGGSEADTRYLDITNYGGTIRLDLFSEGLVFEGVNETFWVNAEAWHRAVGQQEAYEDRNLLVLALASLAAAQGWRVGIGLDPNEPDWPVIFIDLPAGQVSYHLPKAMVDRLERAPEYAGEWDGHTTEEKRERIWREFSGGKVGPWKEAAQ